ncbi:KAP family NTPase [Vibrio splendidus]|uniref:KAP family P-loop NTPase fold protein n=1 Tax=Vibrio splendidus TaxID=29497 RepID=UPI0021B3A378|nr:KAP family NTPase [Vibrio splendidus]UWZ96915.1 hypothetical protein IM698_10880 [Vibrio splendidus]
MGKLVTDNSKHRNWFASHTFNNCKLGRRMYGDFLADYILGEHNGFVLNLNGSWGTGKTEFLKRLYTEIAERNHPVVYINSWESDFSKEPLTVVTSELLNQLERLNQGIGSESKTRAVKHFCGKALKGALVGVAGVASAHLLKDSNIGMEAIKQVIDEESESFTKRLTQDYAEQVEAIERIRELLGQLAEVLKASYGANIPVVVLVDELDRCRPTYAIEMLEVIKHFFTTDNFVFVVATDTEQLCRSITAVYGHNFNSEQYLKRFFDRKASLPEPDLDYYIDALNQDFSQYSELTLFPSFVENDKHNTEFIRKSVSLLAKGFNLKIRDVDQLLNKLHACLRTALNSQQRYGNRQYVHLPALIIGLIEQDLGLESFERRKTENIEVPTLWNKDVNLAKGFNAELFVELSVASVVLVIERHEDHWGVEFERETLPKSTSITSYSDYSEYSEELSLMVSNTNKKIDEFNRTDGSIRYWLWSDMKKVIELAGTIL